MEVGFIGIMDIGFTGTKAGMSLKQKITLTKYLEISFGSRFLHGVCLGADKDASDIAHSLGYFIIGYPGIDKSGNCNFRAECKIDILKKEKLYLERNKDIVNASDIIFATPGEYEEQLRSGTWSTIRYARKIGKSNIVIFPDGTTDVRK